MTEPATLPFDEILTTMMNAMEGVSDLLFVVGRPPQIEVYGKLRPVEIPDFTAVLEPAHTQMLADKLMGANERLKSDLKCFGSCDTSYAVPEVARFRVNVFRQNGCLAIVMRKLNTEIPTILKLRLPPIAKEIIKEKTGLVFITGATGSGKTTTLAALLNELNVTQEMHIVTLEDPIEFLHPHLKATFSQRELGRDFSEFSMGLRAALRQAPKVIFVGEIRDRETMEIALTAAETGHVVYSTLHTISAAQTINRVIGLFTSSEEQLIRQRLADTLRYVVSQRLAPRKGGGRALVTEIMGSNLRTKEAILLGESDLRSIHEIVEGNYQNGWHSFEQSLTLLFKEGRITEETAMLQCVDKPAMRKSLDAVKKELFPGEEETTGFRLDHEMWHLPPKFPAAAG
ncbi:MAG: PilT/PilU family type 4a pilus ATPase [Verrucomicrobiota bacterium]|nr:PilT/PilU family type 4a pilus ATPase [Verrucomicrobiota bacterium]